MKAKITNALIYLKSRLAERSTRIGITLTITLLGGQIAPEALEGYVEVAGLVISTALILLSDHTAEKPAE
jgi:hypothetical protein